jgi:Mn-dependent DtxR family transcriptional regulator
MIFTNKEMLENVLSSLESIISEKTNKDYAHTALSILLQKLENKYRFLDNISENETKWNINIKINEIEKKQVYKAIEAIVRIIYMDLKENAGLFFLSELEARIKPGFINELRENGIDIDLLKIEHHVLYRDFNRLKFDLNNKQEEQQVELINENPQNEFFMELEEVEKDFLNLLNVQGITQDKIIGKLNITKNEMYIMVSRLIHLQLIQYTTNEEITLTEKGENYIKNKFNI